MTNKDYMENLLSDMEPLYRDMLPTLDEIKNRFHDKPFDFKSGTPGFTTACPVCNTNGKRIRINYDTADHTPGYGYISEISCPNRDCPVSQAPDFETKAKRLTESLKPLIDKPALNVVYGQTDNAGTTVPERQLLFRVEDQTASRKKKTIMHTTALDYPTITPKEFLWYPYIPSARVTIVSAPGGTGKTNGLLLLAHSLASQENHLPTRPEWPTPKHGIKTLYISAEETGADLHGRQTAIKMDGAELVHFCGQELSEGINFGTDEGLEAIRDAIIVEGYKLVIFDPMQAFVGKDGDLNKVNEVRPIMHKLSVLALETDCTFIIAMHHSKAVNLSNLNNAASGSTDFINAARSHLIIASGTDKTEKIILHTKHNDSAGGDTVAYTITGYNRDTGNPDRIEWHGFSPITFDIYDQARIERTTAQNILSRAQADDENIADLCRIAREYAQDEEAKDAEGKYVPYSDLDFEMPSGKGAAKIIAEANKTINLEGISITAKRRKTGRGIVIKVGADYEPWLTDEE